MAKGCLVAHIRVDDAEAFKQFGPMSGAAIQEHGGRVLERSPAGKVKEGSMTPLTVVVEFDDLEPRNASSTPRPPHRDTTLQERDH